MPNLSKKKLIKLPNSQCGHHPCASYRRSTSSSGIPGETFVAKACHMLSHHGSSDVQRSKAPRWHQSMDSYKNCRKACNWEASSCSMPDSMGRVTEHHRSQAKTFCNAKAINSLKIWSLCLWHLTLVTCHQTLRCLWLWSGLMGSTLSFLSSEPKSCWSSPSPSRKKGCAPKCSSRFWSFRASTFVEILIFQQLRSLQNSKSLKPKMASSNFDTYIFFQEKPTGFQLFLKRLRNQWDQAAA